MHYYTAIFNKYVFKMLPTTKFNILSGNTASARFLHLYVDDMNLIQGLC